MPFALLIFDCLIGNLCCGVGTIGKGLHIIDKRGFWTLRTVIQNKVNEIKYYFLEIELEVSA